MSEPGDLSRAEFYQLIRGQIEHEDETVNQRVMWQIISQAFFFGAYASLLNAPPQAKDAVVDALRHLLVWGVPIAALLAGAITYSSILASLRTMAYLRRLYENYAMAKRNDDPSSKLYPDIHGPASVRGWALVSPIAMPLVFMVTWLMVLVTVLIVSLS